MAKAKKKSSGGKKKKKKESGGSSMLPKIIGLVVAAGIGWGVYPQVSSMISGGDKKSASKKGKKGKKAKPDEAKVAMLRSILQAKPFVKQCYYTALKEDASIEGIVVLQWEIEWEAGDGYILGGRSAEPVGPGFDTCVSGRLNEIRFVAPSGEGTMKVFFPFAFDKNP